MSKFCYLVYCPGQLSFPVSVICFPSDCTPPSTFALTQGSFSCRVSQLHLLFSSSRHCLHQTSAHLSRVKSQVSAVGGNAGRVHPSTLGTAHTPEKETACAPVRFTLTCLEREYVLHIYIYTDMDNMYIHTGGVKNI